MVILLRALASLAALGFLSGLPTSQGTRCAAATDLVQATRESVRVDPSLPELGDALHGLLRASEMCPGLGDAYYFLSLVGTSLKDPRAQNWRAKAEFYDSKALARGDPLSASAKGRATPTAVAAPPTASPVKTVSVSPFVKRKLALVVGISRFRDPKINSLRYTSADARSVADALRSGSHFDYVKTLLDEEATRKNILTDINELAKMAEVDDLVVLYVSSHGSPDNLDTAGVNYIVTHDTEVSNLYPTAYQMDDLLRDLSQRIKAARVIAFLDTCYSGGTFRELPPGWDSTSRSLSPDGGVSIATVADALRTGAKQLVIEEPSGAKRSDRIAQGVGRVIITSSSQAERSWEDDRIEHGYFTYFLLQALAKTGPISVDQIYAELRIRVPEAVQRDKKQSQHPGKAQFPDKANLYLNDRIR